jgi:hypothetical protein
MQRKVSMRFLMSTIRGVVAPFTEIRKTRGEFVCCEG